MSRVMEWLEKQLPDDLLDQALREYQQQEKTGILVDGVARSVAKSLRERFSITSHEARKIVESTVYQIAARRWLNARNRHDTQEC